MRPLSIWSWQPIGDKYHGDVSDVTTNSQLINGHLGGAYYCDAPFGQVLIPTRTCGKAPYLCVCGYPSFSKILCQPTSCWSDLREVFVSEHLVWLMLHAAVVSTFAVCLHFRRAFRQLFCLGNFSVCCPTTSSKFCFQRISANSIGCLSFYFFPGILLPKHILKCLKRTWRELERRENILSPYF